MLVLKRLFIWVAEMLSFCLLMALFLKALWVHQSIAGEQQSILGSIEFLISGIVFVLFNSGFFLTTAILGVFWRSQKIWIYPAIATGLFVVHLQFTASGWTEREKVPVQLAGALVIFICTIAGGWLFRKWVNSESRTSEGLS